MEEKCSEKSAAMMEDVMVGIGLIGAHLNTLVKGFQMYY